MKVIFTGRHVEVSDTLRASAQERLDKMATYLDDIIDVHVTFAVEKHRHMAEVTLKTRQSDFVAKAETDDMYASLSQAMDKLEAQAHKAAGKVKTGQKGKTVPEGEETAEETES
jgi:putative sigma-54 modulation protein